MECYHNVFVKFLKGLIQCMNKLGEVILIFSYFNLGLMYANGLLLQLVLKIG